MTRFEFVITLLNKTVKR